MSGWQNTPATALLILADGTRLEGRGIGAVGHAAGEVCFNTAMTGYQEILTDPSYAGQIITFTFPHIGNVGTNPEDIETVTPVARTCSSISLRTLSMGDLSRQNVVATSSNSICSSLYPSPAICMSFSPHALSLSMA